MRVLPSLVEEQKHRWHAIPNVRAHCQDLRRLSRSVHSESPFNIILAVRAQGADLGVAGCVESPALLRKTRPLLAHIVV